MTRELANFNSSRKYQVHRRTVAKVLRRRGLGTTAVFGQPPISRAPVNNLTGKNS